jgi:hypothetical protein
VTYLVTDRDYDVMRLEAETLYDELIEGWIKDYLGPRHAYLLKQAQAPTEETPEQGY